MDIKHLGHVLIGGPGLLVQAVQLPDRLGGGLLIALVLLGRIQPGFLHYGQVGFFQVKQLGYSRPRRSGDSLQHTKDLHSFGKFT